METKLPAITRAKLVLTENCQLRCRYCYEEHRNRNMSFDTAKLCIDKIHENSLKEKKVPEISFFGGEPLLVYEELMKPCIEYIRSTLKSRCPISFVTNGILLTEDKLKYFRETNVNFMLSIDGCKEAHDINRVYIDGSSSFEDTEKNITNILKYYPNVMPRLTVTPSNLQYLYRSISYIRDKGFKDIHIIPDLFILPDNTTWTVSDFELLEEQLRLNEEYIIREFEKYEVPIVFRTLADMFPRMVLSNYCKSVEHYRTAYCSTPSARCGIGVLNNISIDIEGNIFSCQHGSQVPEEGNILYLGNIREGVIEERRLNLLEMNQSPLRSQSSDCKSCPLDYICTGGCVPNNYALTKDFTILPDSYCSWTRHLYESASRIVKHFDEKKENVLFKDYFYGVVKRGVICVC